MNVHLKDASPDQQDIRDNFQRAVQLRWRNTARDVKQAILLHDALGIGDKAPVTATPVADRAAAFQRWLDEKLAYGVGGVDGSWTEPFVRRASERGAGFAALGDMQAGLAFLLPSGPPPSAKACHGATVGHLAGICEDVSQRATASVANGLLTRRRPSQIARLVDSAMGHGLKRTKALAEHAVTQAFSQGALDAMEARGVTHVGTISERRRKRPRLKDDGSPDGWPLDASISLDAAYPHFTDTAFVEWLGDADDGDVIVEGADGTLFRVFKHGDGWAVVQLGDEFDPNEPRNKLGEWTRGEEIASLSMVKRARAGGRYLFKAGETKPPGPFGGATTTEYLIRPDDIPTEWKAGPLRAYGRQDFYDPAHAHEEDGRVIPNDPDADEAALPKEAEPGVIYRGMSWEEYQGALKSGVFHSRGEYNIGPSQEGLTYFSKRPEQAAHYASGFAPWQFQPTPSRPGVMVAIKDPGNHVLIAGTDPDEVGIKESVPTSEITRVWLAHPIIVTQGEQDVRKHEGGGLEEGSGSSPQSYVRWEEKHPAVAAHDALTDAPRKNPQPKHPRTGRFAKAHVVARELRRQKKTGRFGRQKPEETTQEKAERAEASFRRVTGRVDVLTAGDDRVCDICDGISDNGPYTINQARGLIPAHPNCRCVFVAAGSMEDAEPTIYMGQYGYRYEEVWDYDPNEPRVEKGETGGGRWTKGDEGIEAYHGSGHAFDRFEESKIGTGQGAASYGRGLYFAEEPAVAEQYQEEMGGPRVIKAADEIIAMAHGPHGGDFEYVHTGGDSRQYAALRLAEGYAPGAIPAMAAEQMGGDFHDTVAAAVKELEPLHPTIETGGHLYKVRIHVKPEEMLDWDTKVEKQSDIVRNVMGRLTGGKAEAAGFTGEEAFRDLGRQIETNPVWGNSGLAAAAVRMRREGIKGIRYWDERSRNRSDFDSGIALARRNIELWERNGDEGRLKYWKGYLADLEARKAKQPSTHNFVVFDPDDVEITHRNGKRIGVTDAIEDDDKRKRFKDEWLRLSLLALPRSEHLRDFDPDEPRDEIGRWTTEGITAYHGSAADFDRFDLSHIQSGEGEKDRGGGSAYGINEYGAGVYLAEEPKVSESYKESIAGLGKGNLYTVKIHARPDEFLDWDAPLSAQPQGVKDLIGSRAPQETTGGHLMAGWIGTGPKGAQRLLGAGIKGVRYLDKESRGSVGYGTHNYVVMDPSILEITHKNGVATSGTLTPSSVHAGGEEFVSPSVETGLSFADAKRALDTPRQAAMLKVSDEIDRALGLTETARSVIGAWADGAENSVLATLPMASWDEIKLSAAMKGYVGDQKAVLAFKQDDAGDSFLYEMHVKGALDDIHQRLLKDGLAFHTLAPTHDGADVYVADLDGGATKAIQEAAKDFHANATYQRGHAEFIGTQLEEGSDRAIRDDARRNYEGVIAQSLVPRGAEIWGRNRDRWSAALGVHQGRLGDRGYDPDEARDPAGRWTALAGSQGHPAQVSTAPITATGRGEAGAAAAQAARGRYTRIDMALLDRDLATKHAMVNLFRDGKDFPMIRQSEWTGNDDQDARLIIDRMKSNLHAMYGDIKPEEVAEWRHWYEGAHNLIGNRMEQYKKFKIDRASMTAVYAAQSPNTEWDINVHYGDQLLDTYFNHATHRFDADMRKAGRDQLARADAALDKEEAAGKDKTKARQNLADMRRLFHEIDGKTLKQLTDSNQEAAWVKLYNDAHDDSPLRKVNVDGSFGDIRRLKLTPAQARRGEQGDPMKVSYGTLDRISNAIDALRSHGDANKISVAVGDKHKVRSFYNNILDPDSPNEDTTIDTHAGGAAWMYPFGGKDTQVQQMLGGSVKGGKAPPQSRVTGIKGTYPFYADAYREFAHETNQLKFGREAQSVLWMKKIQMFEDVPDVKKALVGRAWQDYHDGKIGLAQAQHHILQIAHAGMTRQRGPLKKRKT